MRQTHPVQFQDVSVSFNPPQLPDISIWWHNEGGYTRRLAMAFFPAFQTLWFNYPMGDALTVKHLIGGHVDADWIANTCAIRLSRSLNYSGAPIPHSEDTISGIDGRWYIFRVRKMDAYLRKTYFQPNITVRKQGSPITTEKFLRKRGIIRFDVPFINAAGHFTLWNGSSCAHDDYFSRSNSVELWQLP